MIVNTICGLLFLIIVYIIGLWEIELLTYRNKPNELGHCCAFGIGLAVTAITATFLYFVCKLNAQVIGLLFLVLGIILGSILFIRGKYRKCDLQIVLFSMIVLGILLIPGVWKGEQYYVYRGNPYDKQTYVEEAVAMSMHSISWYENRTEDEILLESDVLNRGYNWTINDRPSAGLLIAVLSMGIGDILWSVYLFRMLIQTMTIISMLALFEVVLQKKAGELGWFQKGFFLLGAILFGFGFWGQIQYDIDAVSQMTAAPILICLTTAVICSLLEKINSGLIKNKQYVMMGLLASGALILYLESALVHGLIYFLCFALLMVLRRTRFSFMEIGKLILIPIAALCLFCITNFHIIEFLMVQITTSVSGSRQEWASYFNAWWLGKHGIAEGGLLEPVSRIVNFLTSFFGFYNLTINYAAINRIAAWLITIVLGIFDIVLIAYLVRNAYVKNTAKQLLGMINLIGISIVIFMICGQIYWSAGKLLYWVSPYLYTVFMLPALDMKQEDLLKKGTIIISILLLISHGFFVLERIYDMKVNYAETGFRGNYPSDQIPGLKVSACFDFDVDEIGNADGVIIDDLSILSDYQFYLQYLKVKLTYAHIPFSAVNDVNYYGEELHLSEKRNLPGKIAHIRLSPKENNQLGVDISF